MNKFAKTLLVFCFVLCLAQFASAATYTVSKIADSADGTCDVDCSLREAVIAAGATVDNDIIVFGSLFMTPQTIILSGTDIIINSNGTLVINGRGANLTTISGNNASRVFTNNTGAVTFIENLRVTGGNGMSTVNTGRAGGVYNNAGTLTLTNLVINGNTAANGGGANNAGAGSVLTLENCTVSGNISTSSGGGMQNFSTSTLNIRNSTISGNTSNLAGLAGGAIQGNGILNIANSTISGNNAPAGTGGGGIIYNGTSLTMNNVTITDNTSLNGAGGLHKSTTTLNANVRNTLIAGNRSTNGASPDVVGAISSQGNNLIGVVGTSTGWIASDLLNRPAFLAPLANNGGATQTHALLPSSPAINAAQNCVVTAACTPGNPPVALADDQRGTGFPRQVGSAVDIGAFESSFTARAQPAPYDFDGDGRTDYAVFRPSNATWYVQGSTGGFFSVQFGVSTDKLTPADFDGDGRTDISVWREGSDPNLANFYLLNSATNNTPGTIQFGKTGDVPIPSDWDGDGKADVAVYRAGATAAAQSFFYYRPTTQPAVNFTTIDWGLGNDTLVPLPADYDGDFKTDPTVFRASASNGWFVRQSSNNTGTGGSWGVPTDKRVPADYDGDGKAELAIFRDGLWARLRLSDQQKTYQNFGTSGDRAVPGDYDADGKTDYAVWRNGTFFVLRSNGNSFASFPFGTSGDVPVASAYIP